MIKFILALFLIASLTGCRHAHCEVTDIFKKLPDDLKELIERSKP